MTQCAVHLILLLELFGIIAIWLIHGRARERIWHLCLVALLLLHAMRSSHNALTCLSLGFLGECPKLWKFEGLVARIFDLYTLYLHECHHTVSSE